MRRSALRSRTTSSLADRTARIFSWRSLLYISCRSPCAAGSRPCSSKYAMSRSIRSFGFTPSRRHDSAERGVSYLIAVGSSRGSANVVKSSSIVTPRLEARKLASGGAPARIGDPNPDPRVDFDNDAIDWFILTIPDTAKPGSTNALMPSTTSNENRRMNLWLFLNFRLNVGIKSQL